MSSEPMQDVLVRFEAAKAHGVTYPEAVERVVLDRLRRTGVDGQA